MDFNKVILGGTLVRDPELRQTRGGKSVCDVALAINKRYTDGNGQKVEESHFFDVTFWGRTAETVAEYFRKGGQILVEGELKQDRWEDRESGQKRSKVKVSAFGFEFCNKNEGGGGGYDQRRDDDDDYDQSSEDYGKVSEEDDEDDEIPF